MGRIETQRYVIILSVLLFYFCNDACKSQEIDLQYHYVIMETYRPETHFSVYGLQEPDIAIFRKFYPNQIVFPNIPGPVIFAVTALTEAGYRLHSFQVTTEGKTWMFEKQIPAVKTILPIAEYMISNSNTPEYSTYE